MSTELVQTGGALAIRPDQTDWTPDQAAVLQQSGIDDDVTKAELSGFLHLCQRTRLDPFSRQIYLIGRKDKKAGRKVFTPQTGIDGYRVVAHRVIAETRETFGYEDTLWCDAAGAWRDVWLPDEAPAAAKVTVLRNGQRFSAVALYREYVQTDWNGNPTRMWKNMGANQIAKCAEALALRKAFPHDLAGVYTAEEMAQADNPSADERHLRAVQPDEADPWATAKADEQQPAASGRDYVAEARAADSADAVRKIYRDAGADGYGPGTATMKTIAAIGKEKAAAEQQPSEDDIPDVETVAEGETEADIAERHLRAAAAKAGLPNLDEEFERSYGLPIAQAGAQQMRQMTAILTGSAA